MNNILVVNRIKNSQLAELYEAGKINSTRWYNVDLPETPPKCLDMTYTYKWDHPVAREQFGEPDGYFKEDNALYLFEADDGKYSQQFILFSGPLNHKVEFVEPVLPNFVIPIFKWLHAQHPDNHRLTSEEK